MTSDTGTPEYATFGPRLLAALIDLVLVSVLLAPVIYLLTGEGPRLTEGGLASWLLTAVPIIWFWHRKSATPGKILLKLEIVDAKTHGKPTLQQFLLRYLGYVLSAVVLGLGFLWIAFDSKSQGWHDLIAGTIVVRRVSD